MRKKTPLQRLLVRRGLTAAACAVEVRRHSARVGDPVELSAGYANRIANGYTPSLRLGLAVVRWAASLGEPLTLADLGLQVEP